MAIPENFLDRFVTYTYHFELHCAGDWQTLKAQDGSASESSTTSFDSNGTLMINTRKDAHQTIDEVSFDVLDPSTTRSDAPIGVMDLKLTVKEPGGFSFIEKVKNRMNELNASSSTSLTWGLKIIFVGRDGDNGITIKTLPMIPLMLVHMGAQFQPEGGVYQLDFQCNTTMASTRVEGQAANYAYISKNISFEANTVEEALQKLEERLNENYREVYTKHLNNDGGAKKVKYSIGFDRSDVGGEVAGVVKRSFASDDKKIFSFSPHQSVASVIIDIIKRSPDMCKKIADSKDKLKSELQQGCFIPTIIPRVITKPDETEVKFDVNVYKGGGKIYTFEYFFADPGQNVDVANFNIEFKEVLALFETQTKQGTDAHANMSATVVNDQRYINSMHEHKVQKELPVRPVERSNIGLKSGDTAVMPAPTERGAMGLNSMNLENVPVVRAAIDTFSTYNAAVDPEHVITLRGHYDLLADCIAGPDETSTTSPAAGGAIWFKVNIYMPEGIDVKGNMKRRQFFYRGYYRVIAVHNTFAGGVFSQQVRIIMNEGTTY